MFKRAAFILSDLFNALHPERAKLPRVKTTWSYKTLPPASSFETELNRVFDNNHGRENASALIVGFQPAENGKNGFVGAEGKWVRATPKFYVCPESVDPYHMMDALLRKFGCPTLMAFDLKSPKNLYDQSATLRPGDISYAESFHRRPAICLPPREHYETKFETAARQQGEHKTALPALRLATRDGLTL